MPRARRKEATNADDEVQAKKRRVQRQEDDATSPIPEEQVDPENQPEDESEDLLSMKIPERPAATMSTDPTAPRLVITKIVVENFKSYYGKQTLGPFHKNFTSILGPNGSGKSNVIDSLLFVFGFRANKIRSKKISVLIHNSNAHPDVRSCTVAVHFAKIVDKDNACDIQPGSEFIVSRTATKSGASSYHINGRPSNTNDVRNKLKANGIDLDHNRFLILQGEVEQISLMKPKRSERSEEDGMLEYLEDIIGSSRLKAPIEKFRKKIEQLTNTEEMIQKKFKLAETEVTALVEPVRKVLRLMKLENAITKHKHKIFSIDRHLTCNKSEAAKQQVEELKKTSCEAEDDLNKCNDEIKKLQKRKADLAKDETNLKEKIDDSDKKKQEKEMEKRDKNNEILQIERRQEKKEIEIGKEKRRLQEAEEAPAKSNVAIKEHQETIDKLKEEIAEHEDQLKDLNVKEREANEETRTELNEIMPQITALSSEENRWTQQLSLANDRLENLLNAANNPQNQLKNAEGRAAELQASLDKNEREKEQLEVQLPRLNKQIKENEQKSQDQRNDEHKMQERINNLQREVEAKRTDASTNSSNNQALNSLMEEKRAERIRGIYGRLGDLGGIDQRYDVAISTCCSQLDHVVVDTVETAQECIEFLRQHQLARMTFIALDKQTHFWDNIQRKPADVPENADRLIDLITVIDQNVKPAFYSVLRDTLFANTIEDATRISGTGQKRWRVVSAKGEVVEASGTMSGGGRKEIRGRMGKRVRVDTSHTTNERDWREMEKEANQLREQLNKLRMEHSTIMDLIKNQKDEYAKLEREHRILSLNIPKIRQQLDRANQEVNKARENAEKTQVDEVEVNKLKADIENFEKEKEEVCKKASKLRQKKEQLDKSIESTEDKILGKTRDHLKKLKAQQAKAEDTCKKERLVLKNSSTSIEKIKRAIKNAEEAIHKAKDDMTRANTELVRLDQKLEMHVQQKAEYEKRLEQTVAEIQQITATLEGCNKTVDELKQKIDEQRRDLHAAEAKMRGLIEKLNDIETSIGKLSLYTVREGILLPSIHVSSQPDTDTQESDPNNPPGDQEEGIQDRSILEVNEQNEEQELGDDEQDDDLLNTTAVTIPDADFTHDPTYDRGMLPTLTHEEIQQLNRDALVETLEKYEKRKERCKDKMNFDLIEEYAEKTEKRDEVIAEMNELREVLDNHRKQSRKLTQMRNDEFNDGFQRICLATQEIYQMITLGGDAMLEKVNSMDTFSEGITFQVRPPKKTWKQITNLSGGEKTLASLALVFGLHTYRPTPLYVMDEIDAALDYRNVSIISTYLKERTKNAQFIIISLRNNMFENGDRLLGIYKVNDCTQNVIYDTECNLDDDSDEENSV